MTYTTPGQPRRSGRARRTAALGLLCALSLSGCGAGNLQFRQDDRLSFQAPGNRDRVTLPVTVAWTMKDFQVVGLDGSRSESKGVFAVFVDRAPMPVGKNLRWLARNDTSCARDPRCPGAEYLSDQGVFLTTTPSVRLEQLPRASDGVGDEQHFVNVVLLDGAGARIGESAWYRPFQTRRTA